MKTNPPLVVAMIQGIMSQPLNIFQVCAWGLGIEKADPWRRTRTRLTTDTLAGWLRQWVLPVTACALVIVSLLALDAAIGEGVLAAAPIVASLKAARQRDADLKKEIAEVSADRSAIGNSVVAEARKMTDDERASFVALGERKASLESDLAENAELLQAAEEANEAERIAQAVPAPDAGIPANRVEIGAELREGERKLPGYFGRQLMAVRRAAIAQESGNALSDTDRFLLAPMQAAATGMNTDVPSEGGFLVESARADGILERAYEVGSVLSRVARLPVGAGKNGVNINAIDETSRADSSRYGGIVSGWLGQGNTLTSGKPKFRNIELKLRKVGAFLYATDEQLDDSVNLEAWINRTLPLELTFRTEDAIFNGTGSNQPLGLLNSGALLTVTRSTASRVLSDDVRGMWARMWAPLRRNAVWYVEQSVEAQLEQLSIAIGTAGVLNHVYRPAGSLPGQTVPTLYGRPVFTVEYGAALGTTGDIVLVNPDEYLLIDKGGVAQAVSIHVAFLTGESVFRFIYRVDGQLSWNSALTPKSGGDTLSCALVLS